MQQLHIFYSGEVQNIGFRHTVKAIADDIGVTGWVRNLPDGRAELLIQGEKESLSKMKNDINNKFYWRMDEIDTTKEKITSIFSNFEVK